MHPAGDKGRYEAIDHTADTGIVAYGKDLPELFENAAFGMFDLMYEVAGVSKDREERVAVEGAVDMGELLVEWLSELLVLFELGLAPASLQVERLEPGVVESRVAGGGADQVELRGPPIKAVTYHGLEVAETGEGWRGRIIFDV